MQAATKKSFTSHLSAPFSAAATTSVVHLREHRVNIALRSKGHLYAIAPSIEPHGPVRCKRPPKHHRNALASPATALCIALLAWRSKKARKKEDVISINPRNWLRNRINASTYSCPCPSPQRPAASGPAPVDRPPPSPSPPQQTQPPSSQQPQTLPLAPNPPQLQPIVSSARWHTSAKHVMGPLQGRRHDDVGGTTLNAFAADESGKAPRRRR